MTHDKQLSVAAVACLLGISEKHVKQIPVHRRGRPLYGVYYLRSEIEAWRDRDLASPDSQLKRLRAKQEDIKLRKLWIEIPYTKTGKKKPSFRDEGRQPPYQNCLACGSPLASKIEEYWEEPYEEDNNGQAGERRPPSPPLIYGVPRNIPVEQKGCRGRKVEARHVQLDVDQVRKNAEAAAHIRPQPKFIRKQILFCKNPRCSEYNDPVEQHELADRAALYELFEHDEVEIDDRSIQAAIAEIGDLPANHGDEE